MQSASAATEARVDVHGECHYRVGGGGGRSREEPELRAEEGAVKSLNDMLVIFSDVRFRETGLHLHLCCR